MLHEFDLTPTKYDICKEITVLNGSDIGKIHVISEARVGPQYMASTLFFTNEEY